MEPNAAVRSRLTHSLEVSQLGRFIADEIGTRLQGKGMLDPLERVAFGNFVETACILHDIGNPPFGHFGEAAIQKWFQDHGGEAVKSAVKLEKGDLGSGDLRLVGALADFHDFDGNPQGLRVIARLQWNSDKFGLNLTTTTLAACLKYIRKAGESPHGLFRKKAGYFTTEESIVQFVWGKLGYQSPQRYPLAYIMEAADDLAYCISDLEDSIEKGLVHEASAFEEVYEKFSATSAPEGDAVRREIARALAALKGHKRDDGKEFTYTDFRTSLNRAIVRYAADRYVEKHDAVLSGTLESLLPTEEAPGAILNVLKTYCRENVYCHESIQRTELAGYTAIRGMLDHFKPLLSVSRADFTEALTNSKNSARKGLLIEQKLLSLFPEKYIKVYVDYVSTLRTSDADNFSEWNARAHLVVDYIAGMTDDFAMTSYRTLAGMRV